MGFLSRIFGKQPLKCEETVTLNGLGTYSVHVVGESNYQENLCKICGGYKEDGVVHNTTAILVHENDNHYDNKAIRVDISGMTVGYLSRLDAQNYREHMLANGHSGINSTCKAKITGGWDRGNNDIGSFGVFLDMPVEFVSPTTSNTIVFNNQIQNTETKEIFFELDKCSSEDLALCKIDSHVSLWIPKDRHEIYVFRSGSIGGQGRLGFMPNKYIDIVTAHLEQKLDYDTKIVNIDIPKSSCRIKCILFSKQETEARHAKQFEDAATKLKSELQKKYQPRNSISVRVSLPKNHTLKEEQELFLEKQPLEYYIQNAMSLYINFIDLGGNVVAKKNNEPSFVRSILKAYFNQYSMKFVIDSIDKPDKYTLNYINEIEAKVTVSFDNITQDSK
jgi:hypothetical protein